MLRRLAPISLSLCLLCLSASISTPASPPQKSAETWPQWRGPNRDGVTTGPGWPGSLQGNDLKELWRPRLAEGHPGAVVAGGRVFVAETKDGREEVVRCLDRRTGRQV